MLNNERRGGGGGGGGGGMDRSRDCESWTDGPNSRAGSNMVYAIISIYMASYYDSIT
jgi:hypothetical protein